ncbi:MAG: DNA-binding response regulator [Bacteroidetes bacterium HGW-Bacteroidetes-2]|jgi:two-component system LytT family response regulator|nr:MAG: DNA-binding response regulator [Bacteroidetes bacterium HGW-Bacteroidetes-2]
MLEVIIIDDEPKSITSLEWELTNFSSEITVLATFTNPLEAISYLKNNHIDCVFLDIEMPQMDGFQFLDLVQNRDFAVVFTTAYDQYAINAIKEKALDYLLKPIDSDDLKITIQKIIDFKNSANLKNSLEESIISFSKLTNKPNKKIAIPVDGKLVFLKTDDIIYCESDGNYCSIYLENNEKLFITKKLKEVDELLKSDCFYRVHNSYLINLEKVKEYFKTDGYVVLNNRKKIPVSRNRKNNFLDKI